LITPSEIEDCNGQNIYSSEFIDVCVNSGAAQCKKAIYWPFCVVLSPGAPDEKRPWELAVALSN